MWRQLVILSLSEWSFTICETPYNRKPNVLSASLNKAFLSFVLNWPQKSIDLSPPEHTWDILDRRAREYIFKSSYSECS